MTFGMPFLLDCGSVEKCAALCADTGLSFVELNISFPSCSLFGLSAERLKGLEDRYNIGFTMHMDEEADPFSFNPAVSQAWTDTFVKAVVLCGGAGIPVINMHIPRGVYITLPSGIVYMHAVYEDAFLEKVAAFRDLCAPLLIKNGVTVCVENTKGFLPVEKTAIELLLSSPAFGLTLDIGHSACAGDCDIPFYEKHTHRLRHMHAHDAVGKRDHLSFGEGCIDLASRLRWAKRENARVLLEIKTEAALRQTLSVLPRYL